MSRIKHEPFKVLGKDIKRNYGVYLMLLPVVVYYFLLHYMPMYGAQIAFKDFSVSLGIWGSKFAGLKHFLSFFNSYYFERLLTNTITISGLDILFGFPAPIILALLLNELRALRFKKFVQTVSYLPHFISIVVIAGLIIDFTTQNGLINQLRQSFGGEPIAFLSYPNYFRPMYILTNVWQQVGWGSIIYLAAIANIDQELYEAAKIDGAGRFRQCVSITLPGLLPMITILLILRMGNIMTIGSEKILLLYNPSTYETADVISTFVYRKGLLEANYSYSTAVGLFNSVINFIILVTVNQVSRKISENSLW